MKFPKLLTAIGLTAAVGIAVVRAQNEETRVATAWSRYFDTNTMVGDFNLVSFPFSNPIETHNIMPLRLPERYCIDQPVRVGDYYYFYTYAQQVYGYDAGGFYRLDMEDGTLKQIADYGGMMSGTAFSKLCYDYTEDVMYCTDGLWGNQWLAILDLETGLHKKTARLKVPLDLNYPTYDDYVATIAINYDGEMYGLTYWGHIVRINKHTGECRVISTMDYNPDTAFMYSESNRMFFDNETGDCYLSLWTWAGRSEIRKLDLATGHSEQFAPYTGAIEGENLYGIYLPFTVAEPSAPAQVTDLTLTPAAKGECKATLSWTNPVKTYGRGGTLEELDKVEIYRNGELIHTIDNPVIGGKETYTETLEKPDYYTYRVVGYNESGRGDRKCVSSYIGMGIPQMPQEVTAVADGDDVKVTWTMPELGSFDAYIDYNDVVYDVIRYEGQATLTETKVAEELTTTEFVDKPERIGRYFYGVVARNNIGESENGQSERLIGGPAIRVPNDFTFNDNNLNQTWTIIDGNGDYASWTAKQNGPWTYVMQSEMDRLNPMPAMEYLLSPPTLLEKDKRYKVTFQAQPGSDKIAEILAVSFGKQPTPAAQDSVTQFAIVSKQAVNLRANLPAVKETDRYHFGFVHRTAVYDYNLSLLGVTIAEDHEGYARFTVLDDKSQKIKGAVISAPGVENAVMNDDGTYNLNYLPQGSQEVTVTAHGYLDKNVTVDIKEWETTPVSVTLAKRPEYTVKGIVKDAVGDPVKDAKVAIIGYDEYTVMTDAEGRFEIPAVYESAGYNISVSKNRHISFNQYTDIADNLDLGTVVLGDNVRAPRTVTATEDSQTASVGWTLPANDVITLRYDDGSGTQLVGLNAGTNESVFGTVFRTPATVHGAQFYIGSMPGINHWNVQLYIFDLDEQGNPTSNILYRNTYVSTTDDQWNTYYLPYPVEAPNGFYLAISYYGNVCIGVDGAGDTEKYPFMPATNYFSQDYTTGKFTAIENAGVSNNFQMRAMASPYDDAAMPKFIRSINPASSQEYTGEPLVITPVEGVTPEAPAAPARVLEDRLRYDVYRFNENDEYNQEAWEKLGEDLSDRAFNDNGWTNVDKGIYKYAVTAKYADGVISQPSVSPIVGRDMHTDLKMNVFTNTPENLSAGAKLSMTSSDTRFHYEAEADESGKIMLPYVWKGVYTIHVTKDGFEPWMTQTELGDEPEYMFSANLKEIKNAPVRLFNVEDDNYPDNRTLVWNIPEMYKESFEEYQGHPVFTIESPGYLGWSYLDGDEEPTGGLNYQWPHQFEPMSWMTFNPDKTTPSMLADNLMPYPSDGEQFIIAVSSGEIANDDWIISPRLYFSEPFAMQFDAAGWNPNAAAEKIQVGYSTTDSNPDSFKWLNPAIELQGQIWDTFTVNLEADVRYVAIRYISQGIYMAMIDNIKIGNPDHIQYDNWGYYTPSYTVPTGPATYEILLNGEKVGTTERNTFELKALPIGHYVAAVRGVYKSGYSDAASTEFDITQTGIEAAESDLVNITLKGRTLTVSGNCESVELVTPTGVVFTPTGSGSYNLASYQEGIYIVRVLTDGKTILRKIVLK